jgi:RHS repeat-associated protein
MTAQARDDAPGAASPPLAGGPLAPPSVALPKGGGAIRGIGEKFGVNPVTGTSSMTVPIGASPGRSGFGPHLDLTYDSGSGNGPFGFGWTLTLPSIVRKTDQGLPLYQDATESDVFILWGAEDLVPVLNEDGTRWEADDVDPDYVVHRYRPRVEGGFARIERWTRKTDSDTHWRSISRDNILSVYGKDASSRIADPTDPTHIFRWLICEARDDRGNAVLYEYKPEDGIGADLTRAHERNRGGRDDPRRKTNHYLKRVRYGNRTPLLNDEGQRPRTLLDAQIGHAGWMFEVVFDYGEHDEQAPTPQEVAPWSYRIDPFSWYRPGFEVRTTRLCRRVLIFHHFANEPDIGTDCLVRSTDLTYLGEPDPAGLRTPVYSLLRQVVQSGYRRENGGYLKASLPPFEFEYSEAVVDATLHDVGEGSLENLPVGVDGAAYAWVDLHGEGIPGILTEQGEAWFYKRNLSPIGAESVELGPTTLVTEKPNVKLAEGAARFADLAGDGQTDVVVLDGPTQGLYEHDDSGEGWGPFRPFTSVLNRNFDDPNLRLVDLDGDGRPDVLISEDDTFVWHASLGEDGFGPAQYFPQAADEEHGPRLVFANRLEVLYLADLSGDGLPDLVRVRNGECCYWPNLGRGFGAKVTMDQAPCFDHPDQFDQDRLRLADIDGTGTTDLIYLHREGARLYFNHSGNSWSAASAVPVAPAADEVRGVQVADLRGNGTACLVWSSPLPGDRLRALRYVDLMGGHKPHLLVKTANNLGAETRISYASSTKFFLQDRRDGRPWVTRLPFPVHVVEQHEIFDYTSRSRFVRRYAYHHGYFDGKEREFRGFGMVEQWDTEELGALAADGVYPQGENVAEASYVPPVHTKTWFHTGAYLGGVKLSNYFAGLENTSGRGEYFREPGLDDDKARALLLPDTVIPRDLTVDEEREACRALKGAMLRQEIYAEDAGPGATAASVVRAATPYTVAEQNFKVRLLQSQGPNCHAIFLSHPCETISYYYERNSADPRIQHMLTLEVDAYGNVLKEAVIGYGRRATISVVDEQGQVAHVPNPGLGALTDADRARQATTLMTYSESSVTNAVGSADAHRNPLPCEVIKFELTGYVPTGPGGRFQATDLVEPDPDAAGCLHHRFVDEVAYEAPPTANPCRRLTTWLRTLYRSDDLTGLSPLGQLQSRGLLGESYRLAFTPGLLAQVFQRPRGGGQPPEALVPDPALVLGGQGGDRGGYLHSQTLKADRRFPAGDADDIWWLPTGQSFFTTHADDGPAAELTQARKHFFLPRRYRSPFGEDVSVDFDGHDLLLVETRDALDNRVTVDVNDYRVLQPRLVSDPNRNRTEVAFDALGLVAGTAVMGKSPPAPTEGDSLDGFVADLTQAQLDGFFEAADPHAGAAALLRNATTRIVYDLDRFRRTRQTSPDDTSQWQPPSTVTIARETDAAAPLPPPGMKIQLSFSYSDGLGRVIQKKLQAEPGTVVEGGTTVDPRWVASGWTVFNNKGNPVRQYEPFFSATHQFEFGVKVGVSPVLFYDPVGRVIAALNPDHTYEKVVFNSWQQTIYDATDTCAARNDETGDPRTDPDIQGYLTRYFARLPAAQWQTWYAQRIGGILGPHEQTAAIRAAAHADTPTTSHFDALGRPFLTVERNRVACPGHDLDGTEAVFCARVELDIEGNQRALRDAIEQAGDPLGRVVMRYAYDLRGNRIYQLSMEAGARWNVYDVEGKPIRAWDSRGHNFTTSYDPLRRPLEHYVRGTTAGSDPRTLNRDVLSDKIEYGEPRASASQAEVDRALRLNLRTRIYRHFDSAGVVTNARLDTNGDPLEAYDFKGNLLCSTRRFASDYAAIADWLLSPMLDAETFVSSTRYDALNRPIQSVAPHSTAAGANRNIIQPKFNDANMLEGIDVWLERTADPTALLDPTTETPSPIGVADIDYDAKGQRQRIDYKNGASTFYHYDPLTFRLMHLYTRRDASFTGDCDNPQPPPPTVDAADTPLHGQACGLQNLHYTYDPAGNITHIDDDSQQTIYFRNRRVEPSNDYTYDALYRLIQATGREHLGQTNGVANPPTAPDASNAFHTRLDHPGDGNAMGTYIERYVYDAAGNFLQTQHRGSDPGHAGWTRVYDYAEASLTEDGRGGALLKSSNRLTRTTLNPNSPNSVRESYQHDGHGNIVRMPLTGDGLPGPNAHWNYRDELLRADLGGGTAYYVYDASGQRVRKVWEKAQGLIEERIYLGGAEIYRRHGGAIGANSTTLERETLYVLDDKQRIALVETRRLDTAGSDQAPACLTRYQFSNHLGSISLELDDQAQIISYEEYAPYGSSTYQAVRSQTETPKRYRYTGKERDEETGLYYHGARYYASWLGRWVSCDPAGPVDDYDLYRIALCNPVRFVDSTGNENTETTFVTPMMKKYLENSKIPYVEQVNFELLDKSGKVVTKGRFDMVFRDPHDRLVIPELKGVNLNKLHGNQPIYSDQLVETGGRIRFTSRKTSAIGIPYGKEMQLRQGDYFRMGKMDLPDFEEALQQVSGGKPIAGRYLNESTGEYRAFTSKEEYHSFLESKGIQPTRKPTGDPDTEASMDALKISSLESARQDFQQYFGSEKSEIDTEIDNQTEWGIRTGVELAAGGPAGAFKAVLDPERLGRASATIMVSPHMFGARGGLGALVQYPHSPSPPLSPQVVEGVARAFVGTFGPVFIAVRESLSVLTGTR